MCAIAGLPRAARGLRVARDHAQRRRESLRVAGQLCGRRIRDVLPAAADRDLDQERRDRREDQRQQHDAQDDDVARATAAVAVAAAEEQRAREDPREHGDRPREHRGPRHQAHVVVADVAHLVGEHALQLLLVEALEQAGRDGEDGLLGSAPGGERVGRVVRHDVDPRHRHPGGDREVLDHAKQLGRLLLALDPARAGDEGDEVVRHVQVDDQHEDRDHDRDHQRGGSEPQRQHVAERAVEDQEADQQCQRLPLVRCYLLVHPALRLTAPAPSRTRPREPRARQDLRARRTRAARRSRSAR